MTDLREEPTRFVGRARELVELAGLWQAGVRLVTIGGPPGIGKTRLAVHAALVERDRFSGGLSACDLSEARSVEAVATAVLHALDGGPPPADADLVEVVGAQLAARGPTLLLLDGIEGAVDAVAACVVTWLSRAPAAQLVITSRERCALPGERLLDLGGLALPAPGATHGDAVELFCDRADAASGQPGAAARDERTIAEIVRQLEGNPLAIELAAARARVLGPVQILEQLPRALDLFRRGRPDRSRHATLRSAIDWSWRLLSPWEQAALAQISVFRGGFGLDAAEVVVDLTRHQDAPPILDVLQGLCDKSLVVSAEAPGERRFRCTSMIQEYASQELTAQGDADAAGKRHARFFARLAAEWPARSRGPDQAAARARVRLERSNLLVAHERALAGAAAERTTIDLALEILPALEVAVLADQPIARFHELLDRTIAAAGDDASPQLLARALLMRLRASFAQARVDARDAERALVLLGESGDSHLRGLAHYYAGYAWWYRGDLEPARASFERAVELFAAAVPPSHLWPHALADLAKVHLELGEHDRARAHAEEALSVATRSGASSSEWIAQRALVALHRAEGHAEEALRRAERSRAIAGELGETWRQTASLHDLADLERDRGDLTAARRTIEEAAAYTQQIGWPLQRAYHGVSVAFLDEEAGDSASASRHLGDACEAFRAAGFARDYALLLAQLAVCLAGADRVDEARPTLARARAALTGALLSDAVIDLAQAHIELALARRAHAAGDAAAWQGHRDAAAELVSEAGVRFGRDHLGRLARVPICAVVDVRLLDRRYAAQAGGGDSATVVLDAGAHELRCGDRVVSLRSRPAVRKLLYALCARPGEILDKDELCRAIWGAQGGGDDRETSLRANVRNLRQLLRDTGLEIEFAERGYLVRVPPSFMLTRPADGR